MLQTRENLLFKKLKLRELPKDTASPHESHGQKKKGEPVIYYFLIRKNMEKLFCVTAKRKYGKEGMGKSLFRSPLLIIYAY